MSKGSFKGLYTFDEIARIYNMDSSSLRKMVQYKKFKENEIKKFGKTWIITEQAVDNHFGIDKLNMYKESLKLKELQEFNHKKQVKKSKKLFTTKASNNDISNGDDRDIPELGDIKVNPKNIVFSFKF